MSVPYYADDHVTLYGGDRLDALNVVAGYAMAVAR